MRRVENGLAYLQSWLVFPTQVNPLDESWRAHATQSQKRVGAFEEVKILNNNKKYLFRVENELAQCWLV